MGHNRQTLGCLSLDMVNIDIAGPIDRKCLVTKKVAEIMALVAKHEGYVDVFTPISDGFGYHMIFAFECKEKADAFRKECHCTENS